MAAKGKINASNVQAGDRIVVRIERNDAGLFTGLHESRTKTHADDLVVRVTGKTFRTAQGPYEARGKYVIETTAGAFEAAPIQTMILAPEDAAGIKRAYAEALEEDEEFTRVRKAMAELDAETLKETLPKIQGEPKVPARPLVDATAVVDIKPEATIPGLKHTDGSPVTVSVSPAKPGEDMSPLPVTGTYRVTFVRVGRRRDVPPLDVKVPAAQAWNTANEIAFAVHKYVSKFLTSWWFEVDVDMTYGRVVIDDGRFGEGKAVLIRE